MLCYAVLRDATRRDATRRDAMPCYGQVSAQSPALMVAVALAMSIDYSLFLLTRFNAEVRRPTRQTHAPSPRRRLCALAEGPTRGPRSA